MVAMLVFSVTFNAIISSVYRSIRKILLVSDLGKNALHFHELFVSKILSYPAAKFTENVPERKAKSTSEIHS